MTLFRADPAESPRTAHRFSRSIVGAESNLAIGLCRLSWQAGWLGRVGDDPLGMGITVIPFLRLRDGTHPLAARTWEPRPLAQARQIRPATPVGAKNLGPAGRSCRKTTF